MHTIVERKQDLVLATTFRLVISKYMIDNILQKTKLQINFLANVGTFKETPHIFLEDEMKCNPITDVILIRKHQHHQ